jgi:hypothetical protein
MVRGDSLMNEGKVSRTRFRPSNVVFVGDCVEKALRDYFRPNLGSNDSIRPARLNHHYEGD